MESEALGSILSQLLQNWFVTSVFLLFLHTRVPGCQKGYDSCIFFIMIVFHSECLRLFSNLVVRELKIIHKKNYKFDIIVVISNRGSSLTAKEMMLMVTIVTPTIIIIIKILFM